MNKTLSLRFLQKYLSLHKFAIIKSHSILPAYSNHTHGCKQYCKNDDTYNTPPPSPPYPPPLPHIQHTNTNVYQYIYIDAVKRKNVK